jgi:hypothetical protein
MIDHHQRVLELHLLKSLCLWEVINNKAKLIFWILMAIADSGSRLVNTSVDLVLQRVRTAEKQSYKNCAATWHRSQVISRLQFKNI